MKITVIGTGYVGLVVGTCMADMGNDVICVDVDDSKISKLKKGIPTIYEIGLEELLKKNIGENRISFTDDIRSGIQKSDVIFLAVGTPSLEDGNADLSYIEDAAREIARHINGYKVVATKSTVPVGTGKRIKKIIKQQNRDADFDVVSNPEFLREGKAIKDFMNPYRIIIGSDSEKAKRIMLSIYKSMERVGRPILITNLETAELIKYASNAMLATRISFMNQLSCLCEAVGADIKTVAIGLGQDPRIGPRFLQAGVGYGGSCFPKDVKALKARLQEEGCCSELLEAVENINSRQKLVAVEKLKKIIPDLHNKKVAVWGIAFKPNTDDIREAPSVVIIKELQKSGVKIKAFDPIAAKESKKILKNIEYAENPYDVVKGCDALIIVTEWNEFRDLDKEKVRKLMRQPIIIDGRNIYEPDDMGGFNYHGIGRGCDK